MKRQLMTVVFAIMGIFLCATAQAQWYAGISVGKPSDDVTGNPCGVPAYSCKGNDMAGTVRLGYRISPYFSMAMLDQVSTTSIELAYARFGAVRAQGPLYPPSTTHWDDKLSSVSLGTAVEVRVTPNGSFVTRLGVSSMRATADLSTAPANSAAPPSSTQRSTQLYYGVGGAYRLTQQVSFTGDVLFTRAPYSVGSTGRDIRLISAGLTYFF